MYLPKLENSVKMVILSFLFDLASFYLPTFHIKAEPEIKITCDRLLARH
jgi:hypothetical protein